MFSYGGRVSGELSFEGDFYHRDDDHTRGAISSSVHGCSFQDRNTAPHVPADPSYRLEATTVFIGGLCNSAAGRIARFGGAMIPRARLAIGQFKAASKASRDSRYFGSSLNCLISFLALDLQYWA